MYIADLHIHSRYSRATSRDCTPEQLDIWARRKGIDIVGTGDFTHPAWREELKDKLEPGEDGLYYLCLLYTSMERCFQSESSMVFVLYGTICNIADIVDRIKDKGKIAIVHADLISGLNSKEIAVDFLRENTKACLLYTSD